MPAVTRERSMVPRTPLRALSPRQEEIHALKFENSRFVGVGLPNAVKQFGMWRDPWIRVS